MTAKRLLRHIDISHKDFMFAQKAEWKEFHRIPMNEYIARQYKKQKEIEWWCNEHLTGRWFHSDGFEMYYFDNEDSAVMFKLKYHDDTTNPEMEN